jgi:acetyl esterase/lipase
MSAAPMRIDVPAPAGFVERLNAAMLRVFLRVAFRPVFGPRFGAAAQRRWVNVLCALMPARRGIVRSRENIAGVDVERIEPRDGAAHGVILYLHGGAFCVGSAWTHRSVSSHLACASGMPVCVPDYRLAPEHPFPCALDDALGVYRSLLDRGHAPHRIVVGGDSAGGALALALALRLRDSGQPMPAGLILISPVTDLTRHAPTGRGSAIDPMIDPRWLDQALSWYRCPDGTPEHAPLHTGLAGLPPMLVQAGDQEILLPGCKRLEAHATQCGVECRLEIHRDRWHVFHLQTLFLRSSVTALQALGAFARERVDAIAPTP